VAERLRIVTTADGSQSLYSEAAGQAFHSHHGAVTESEHVFLRGSGVAARLADGEATNVLEVGFGTGLNALLTLQRAQQAGASLTYWSLEHDLLPAEILAALNHGEMIGAPELQRGLKAWRETIATPAPLGNHQLVLGDNLTLEVVVGDATSASIPAETFHAVYLDAFSPEANPELWTPAFLLKLAESLVPGGCLTTFSVKGSVRRALSDAGLRVEKRPGPPGGKREMTVALK